MITEKLRRFDLTDGESKAYLALSELGPSTVGPIVKKASIAYANIYDVLRRLQNKGLVSYITKGKAKVFSAAPPDELKNMLVQKQKKLEDQAKLLKDLLPELEKLQETHEPEKAEVFLGFKGLRVAYKKLIENNNTKEIMSIYNHKNEYAGAADEFFYEIYNEYKLYTVRVIADKSFKDADYAKKVSHPLKYVDTPLPSQIDVCGSKVLLISWQKPILSVLITAESFANNFKDYFEALWKKAKE
ncbi:MAG: TrmB family transcriptional regulator [Candidatus Woesearchaeota archaeon]